MKVKVFKELNHYCYGFNIFVKMDIQAPLHLQVYLTVRLNNDNEIFNLQIKRGANISPSFILIACQHSNSDTNKHKYKAQCNQLRIVSSGLNARITMANFYSILVCIQGITIMHRQYFFVKQFRHSYPAG